MVTNQPETNDTQETPADILRGDLSNLAKQEARCELQLEQLQQQAGQIQAEIQAIKSRRERINAAL